jgi:uncharacterized protein YgfB (UPF0149 family)
MATITLTYDSQDSMTQKALDFFLSLGLFQPSIKKKKTSLDRAFEDIEKGRVHRLITPAKAN